MLRSLNYIDTFIIVSSLIHHPLVTAAWLTIRNYSGLLAACGGSPGFGVGAGGAARRRCRPHPRQNPDELPEAVRSQARGDLNSYPFELKDRSLGWVCRLFHHLLINAGYTLRMWRAVIWRDAPGSSTPSLNIASF